MSSDEPPVSDKVPLDYLGSPNNPVCLWPGIIRQYRDYLSVSESTPVVTLQEGNTPLIEARLLAERLDLNAEVLLKLEGLNPTGSFKDRGMT